MKFERSKAWWLNKVRGEQDAFVGAGLLARDLAPDEAGHDAAAAPEAAAGEEMRLAFGRFVSLIRRQRGLTVEQLAARADLDLAELVSIEEDLCFQPEPRTIYQLASTFDVPQQALMQLAGLAVVRDTALPQEAVRFAARSETTQKLSREEKAALDAFLAVLSQQGPKHRS